MRFGGLVLHVHLTPSAPRATTMLPTPDSPPRKLTADSPTPAASGSIPTGDRSADGTPQRSDAVPTPSPTAVRGQNSWTGLSRGRSPEMAGPRLPEKRWRASVTTALAPRLDWPDASLMAWLASTKTVTAVQAGRVALPRQDGPGHS